VSDKPILSNQTVMVQIRRNIVDDMLGALESGQGNVDEFLRFLVLEPVDINWDTYERLTRVVPVHVGFGRQQVFRIDAHLEKPKWRGLRSAWQYIKERINHHFEKMVIRLLRDHLVMEYKVATTAIHQRTLESFKKGTT
jgi:hypothetical protein